MTLKIIEVDCNALGLDLALQEAIDEARILVEEQQAGSRRKGGIELTIKVKIESDLLGKMDVSVEHDLKKPKRPALTINAHTDKDGSLVAIDASQPRLPFPASVVIPMNKDTDQNG